MRAFRHVVAADRCHAPHRARAGIRRQRELQMQQAEERDQRGEEAGFAGQLHGQGTVVRKE